MPAQEDRPRSETVSAPTPGDYIGIDLGGTNMQLGLVSVRYDASGRCQAKVLGRKKLKTRAAEGLEGVLERICEGVRGLLERRRQTPADVTGVGIGAPGPADPYKGVVLEAVNLRWNEVPLSHLLAERLGTRVLVDNDVNVALVGESRLGVGREADPLLGVWIGTGIGGALMLGGRLHYGRFFTAGEIGHMQLYPMCPPGQRTLEQNCSRTAIVDRLRRLISANEPSLLIEKVDGDLSRIKSRVLGEAYREGDALTVEVIDNVAELVGIHIGSVHTLLSLERVVLGGGLTEAIGEPLVARVRAAAQRVAFPDAVKGLDVVATSLEDDAGVLGAAILAAERVADPRFGEPEVEQAASRLDGGAA